MQKPSANSLKAIIAFTALLVAASAFMSVYFLFAPHAQEGSKTIYIEIINDVKNPKAITLNTDAEYLRQALEENHLISGEDGQYGLFITTVDGVKADDSKREWWRLSKSGEMLMTSADQTPITDGDRYEITITTGY